MVGTRITRGLGLFGSIRLAGVLVTPTKVVTVSLNASSVDGWMFIADRAYRVTGIREDHAVAGGSGAAVKLRKVTADAVAPGAAAGADCKELQTAAFDLTATANTKQTGTLVATAADLLLATGDKVGYDMAGTLTGLAGCNVSLFLVPV